MVLVQHHCNLTVARAEHDFDVQSDQCPQSVAGIGDSTHWLEHALLGDLHGMVHDLEQDFVFTLEVVVEASLAQLECGGDIVHRRGVVPALLKQPCGGAQNFLPGVDDGVAGHRLTW